MIIEYQKAVNVLDNRPNQPTKFRTKNWVEVNDDWRGRITPIVKLNAKLQ